MLAQATAPHLITSAARPGAITAALPARTVPACATKTKGVPDDSHISPGARDHGLTKSYSALEAPVRQRRPK